MQTARRSWQTASRSLNDSIADLQENQADLDKNKKDLDEGLDEVRSGINALDSKKTETAKQLAEAQTKINEGKTEITKQLVQIEAQLLETEYGQKSEQAKNLGYLLEGLNQIKATADTMETSAAKNAAVEQGITALRERLGSSADTVLDAVRDYESLTATIAGVTGQKTLLESDIALKATQEPAKTLLASKAQLEAADATLSQELTEANMGEMLAAIEIGSGSATLNVTKSQLKSAKEQLDSAQEQLDSARDQISDAQDQINDGWDSLRDGEKELNEQKQTGYSTGEVSDKLSDKFEKMMAEDSSLDMTPLMDQGIYIDLVMDSILSNILFGAVLAILILIAFLRDLRPTFVIACSIPISLVTALVCMYFSGVTLNIISLSGLALGIGMLVDNSIVVIENIYRMRSQGMPMKEAAIEGAKEVSGAIMASTLTTVCVFVPIIFTEGITRQLFVDMGLTIGYSLLASLVVALTVVPSMASKVLVKTEEKKESRFFGRVTDGYQKLLEHYDAPDGYTMKLTGENETINDAMGQLMLMMVLAIVFMYLIMVAQFQSLLSPFIIMFTIPLAFTGGFLGLFLGGFEVSVIAMIGFIMLAGIIVNNGIVLIDYMNQLRESGMEKREAILTAGKTRLRPVLMTAMTTILAMSTMVFSSDMGSDMARPMAVVIIGGLLYGTLLTLFVIPCIYDWMMRRKKDKKKEAEA